MRFLKFLFKAASLPLLLVITVILVRAFDTRRMPDLMPGELAKVTWADRMAAVQFEIEVQVKPRIYPGRIDSHGNWT